MSFSDPQWIKFPRWIEYSGIPNQIVQTIGVECWIAFRKLIELECDQNLTPDWFTFHIDHLSEFTGLSKDSLLSSLAKLEEEGWIERTDTEFDVQNARISVPMEAPADENQIREKLGSAYIILRYNQNLAALQPTEIVVFLYQMIFGVRFNPRIAEDLEEIANSYDMGLIYDVFAEAHRKKAKSLSWVKTHLYKKLIQQLENDKPIQSDWENNDDSG